MKLWQVKLGEAEKQGNDFREEIAAKYSLLTIDYGIDEDLTAKNETELRSYFANARGNSRKIMRNRIQTIDFILHIKEADIAICPFLLGGKQFRIGSFMPECKQLEDFLPMETLADIAKKYGVTNENIGCRPTRKVKWLTSLFDGSNFVNELEEEMKRKRILGTVVPLDFSYNLPQGTVKDTSIF